MRINPRLYRQNIRPLPMDREAHLDAYRGLKDVERGLSLGRYCFEHSLSSEDYQWMKWKLKEIKLSKAK